MNSKLNVPAVDTSLRPTQPTFWCPVACHYGLDRVTMPQKDNSHLQVAVFRFLFSVYIRLKKSCRVKSINDGQCDTTELWEVGWGKFVSYPGFRVLARTIGILIPSCQDG